MDKILRENSPVNCDTPKTTFKPLQDLKFFYQQKSDATSIKAQVSIELPNIVEQTAKKRNFSTKTSAYTSTINNALKMRLKFAQLHDEISLIDLKMNESAKKFQNAQTLHENFTKSFEQFLTKQYEKVTTSLEELEKYEGMSIELKNKWKELRRESIEKSLEIYDLENIWRKYKTSQNFLLHLSGLLQNNKEYDREFHNLQNDERLTLDELMSNFENLNADNVEFKEDDFKELTAERIMELLSKLKRQNLAILHYKLHYQKLSNILADTNKFLEEDFQNNFEICENTAIGSIKEKTNVVADDVRIIQKQCKILEKKVLNLSQRSPFHSFIEQLYEKCFKTNPIEKSHLVMVKCIEDYCHLLLCTLNRFDRDTVAKATSLSKK